jgi:hypothetical protein
MHRHKAIARIFLFLSFVNFTFAELAQTPTVHEVRVDLVTGAEDAAGVSETGHTQSEEFPELLGRPSTAGPLHTRVDIMPIIPAPESGSASNPDNDKFFSKELIRRMKEYLILGGIAGVFVGLANSAQKDIAGKLDNGAYVIFHLSPILSPANT